jgi:hypothetical protein
MRFQASDTSSSIAAGSSLPVDDDRHAKPGTRAWSSVLAAVGRHGPSELMRSWATLWVVQSVASEDPSAGGEVPSADGPLGNVRAPLHGACLLGVLGIVVVLPESSARLRAGADHGRRSALSIKPWSNRQPPRPRFERRRPQATTRAGRRTPAPPAAPPPWCCRHGGGAGGAARNRLPGLVRGPDDDGLAVSRARRATGVAAQLPDTVGVHCPPTGNENLVGRGPQQDGMAHG